MTWLSCAIIGGVAYAAAVAGVLKFLAGATAKDREWEEEGDHS